MPAVGAASLFKASLELVGRFPDPTRSSVANVFVRILEKIDLKSCIFGAKHWGICFEDWNEVTKKDQI